MSDEVGKVEEVNFERVVESREVIRAFGNTPPTEEEEIERVPSREDDRKLLDSISQEWLRMEKEHELAVQTLRELVACDARIKRDLNVRTFPLSPPEFRLEIISVLEHIRERLPIYHSAVSLLIKSWDEYDETIPDDVSLPLLEQILSDVLPMYHLAQCLHHARPDGRLALPLSRSHSDPLPSSSTNRPASSSRPTSSFSDSSPFRLVYR